MILRTQIKDKRVDMDGRGGLITMQREEIVASLYCHFLVLSADSRSRGGKKSHFLSLRLQLSKGNLSKSLPKTGMPENPPQQHNSLICCSFPLSHCVCANEFRLSFYTLGPQCGGENIWSKLMVKYSEFPLRSNFRMPFPGSVWFVLSQSTMEKQTISFP